VEEIPVVKIGHFTKKYLSWKYLLMIFIVNASISSNPVIRIIPVGSATDSGSYCFGTSGVELRGTGKGLLEKNDGFLFAYSITSGNCDLQTRCDFTDTSKDSETGLMFRADTSDSAPFCALLVSKNKGTYIKYRNSAGQNIRVVFLSNFIHSNLRINRQGTAYSFFYKTDADSIWNTLNNIYTFNFPSIVCVGAFYTSNDTGFISGVRFNYINGLPEGIIPDSTCSPIIFNFDSKTPLDSLGFRNIQNWELDTVNGTIISKLSKDSIGIASIITPQLNTGIRNDTLTVSWDLRIDADSTPPWIDYSLFSIDKMELGDRVKVSGLRIGSSARVEFGTDDSIQSDVFAGGKVIIKDRSSVWGKVVTAEVCSLGTGAFVSEAIYDSVSQSFPVIPLRNITIGTTKIIISPNDSINLIPGNYDSLLAGADSKILFSPGSYSFSAFILQPQVKLYMDTDSAHRIDINIAGKTIFGDRTKMIMKKSFAYGNVSFYSNDNDTVKYGADLILYGTFFAPNAVSKLISRNVIIKGGIYSRKIKAEPDVKIIANTQHIDKNNFKLSFIPSDSAEPEHYLSFVIHRGMGQDSIIDIILQKNSDTLTAVSTGEKTPLNRFLHFEQMFFPADSGFLSRLLYNNGTATKQLYDSVPFNMSNLNSLIFAYNQESVLRQNILHIDNIAVSCIEDTCPSLILINDISDISIYEGAKVTFACSVSVGKSIPVFQWYCDSTPIPMSNNPVYSINNVSLSENGKRYSCHVTSVCGEKLVTSSALLTVNPCNNPLILSNPVSDTVKLGQSVTFSVTVHDTGCEFEWRRNDHTIPGAEKSSYTIDSVEPHNNMDRYCVLIRNDCGKEIVSNCATLTISDVEHCRIMQHPLNDTLMVNDYYRAEVQFTCNGGIYSWFKNNIPIPGGYAGTLIYGPLSMDDNGATFYCIVNNGVTSDTSDTASIIVRPPSDNNSSISISGDLFDVNGKIGSNGDSAFFDFTVKIFVLQNGGNDLYTENQKNVKVRDGQFTITLGRGTSKGDLQKITSMHKELYAEIWAGEKGTMRIIGPRLRLTAIPYAFSSGIKVIYGNGSPETVSTEVPIGTLYIDGNDNNRTWKLGKLGWVKLD